MSVPQPYHPPPYPLVVVAKSPALSLLASFFIPGLGSMLNGQAGKGVAIFIGHLACTMIVVLFWWLLFPLLAGFGALAFWIWGMVDAYTGAVAWNRYHGIVS